MGLSPAQLRTAYGIDHLWDDGYRGRGARIAVLDFAGYLHSDIDVWRDCFGLAGTPVTDHIVGSPGFVPGVSDETTLDIQTVISFAPDADRIDWFGVEGSATTLIGQYLQLFSAPLDASQTGGVAPDVLTASFGNCETDLFGDDPAYLVGISIFDQVLATAVASGIGAFASTGDTGSTGCYPNGPGTPDNTVSPQFPALSRWITAVGGTNLTLGEDNRIVSSGVWNDRWYWPTPLPQDGAIGSSGGGLSQYELRQPWQPLIGSGLHRPIPDISAFADGYPGYFLYFQGQWMAVGGTSASTPFSATAFALQSSARVAQGRSKLGFVAPLLHQLASSGDGYASKAIVDVVLGNNDAHLVGVYPATEGYDLASGLGWVDHGVLFELLNPTGPIVPNFTG
jgi:subtilase family serine protease